MTIKLLIEHHLEFLTLKKAAQACLSLHFLEITCRGSFCVMHVKTGLAMEYMAYNYFNEIHVI